MVSPSTRGDLGLSSLTGTTPFRTVALDIMFEGNQDVGCQIANSGKWSRIFRRRDCLSAMPINA